MKTEIESWCSVCPLTCEREDSRQKTEQLLQEGKPEQSFSEEIRLGIITPWDFSQKRGRVEFLVGGGAERLERRKEDLVLLEKRRDKR